MLESVKPSLNAQPEGFRIPPSFGLDEKTEADVRERAWKLVLQGDVDEDDFIDWVTDDDLMEEDVARQIFDFVLEARRQQLAALGGAFRVPLTAAFEELDSLGVVARQNFSCCGNCASAEIGAERPEGRESRGYVYFHAQDTEALLESNETFIGYGAFIDAFINEAEFKALSEAERSALYERTVLELMVDTVLPVFERHGIEVEWDRSLNKRILLKNVEYFAPL